MLVLERTNLLKGLFSLLLTKNGVFFVPQNYLLLPLT
jgi:hypothetical protein